MSGLKRVNTSMKDSSSDGESGDIRSVEDDDLLARSKKKVRDVGEEFSGDKSGPISYDDLDAVSHSAGNLQKKTFSEALTGCDSGNSLLGAVDISAGSSQESEDEVELSDDEPAEKYSNFNNSDCTIIEHEKGNLFIPEFVFSEKVEAKICKPFKRTLIVKLIGRMISLKDLENRVKQMWARNGIVSVADLPNDFFVVTFTNMDDYEHALEGGPWMIYDHYLLVRTWCQDFKPSTASVDHLLVWVRFPELPMEYYDVDVLEWFGNRIGKAIKNYMTTTQLSRGKFARMCIEVDLSKPLLPYYFIKGEQYRIEYEGLHSLCFLCGKFGHINVNCPDKKPDEDQNLAHDDGDRVPKEAGEKLFGPWTLVKKNRKKIPPSSNNASQTPKNPNDVSGKNIGSRFEGLMEIGEDEAVPSSIAEIHNVDQSTVEGSRAVIVEKTNKLVLQDSDKHNRRPPVVNGSAKSTSKGKEMINKDATKENERLQVRNPKATSPVKVANRGFRYKYHYRRMNVGENSGLVREKPHDRIVVADAQIGIKCKPPDDKDLGGDVGVMIDSDMNMLVSKAPLVLGDGMAID